MNFRSKKTKWEEEDSRKYSLFMIYHAIINVFIYSILSVLLFLLLSKLGNTLGWLLKGLLLLPLLLVCVLLVSGMMHYASEFCKAAIQYCRYSKLKTFIQDFFCRENIQEYLSSKSIFY